MGKKNKRSKRNKKIRKKQEEITHKKVLLWEKHPDWFVLGVIFILLIIFFNPVLFSNKSLLPPDTIASKAIKPFINNALDRGIYPLWNPYIFGGMPSFASLSGAPYVDIVGNVIHFVTWLVGRVIHLPDFSRIFCNYLLFGGLIYLLIRSRKMSPMVALFSGLAMVFMIQVVAYSAFGHNTKLASALLIPLIFLLMERMLEKRNLFYFCALALVIGMQLLRKHIQIIYYTQMMLGLYFVYWTVVSLKNDKKIRKVLHGAALLVGVVILGLCLSSIMTLSVWEYAQYSIRGGGSTGGLGYDYATDWSFPPSEIATFFIPSFMGFGGTSYWGPMPFTDFPIYFGIIPLFLAGFALIFNRNRIVWFFTILGGIVLLMSFGKHFPVLYWPMFNILPLFHKFRAPKMILILLGFSISILAAYGLQGILQFQDDRKSRRMKTIKRYVTGFGGIVVFLFLILLLGKGLYLGWAAEARDGAQAAYDKAMTDGLRALFFFGISAVSIVMALRKKIPVKWLPILLAILLIVDLWGVNRRFMRPQPQTTATSYFRATADVQYLKKQEGQFRIFPVEDQRSPNWYVYHGIQSAHGYQGAKLRLYQELIDAFKMPNGFIQKYVKIQEGRPVLRDTSEVDARLVNFHGTFLKLMNVRYIISPYPLPDTTLKIVFPPRVRGGNAVFEFKGALPRVFFPGLVMTMNGKDNILNYMTSSGFDPAVTAVIEEDAPFQIAHSDSNQAKIMEYDLHRIVIDADVKAPSLLVVSEMYYPAGWKVFVDGIEEKIIKTNHAFRSVFLQPGTHEIVFSFKPKIFRLGLLISSITFLLLIAGTFLGWRMERKKPSVQEMTETGN